MIYRPILNQLQSELSNPNCEFILLKGTFGVGKTYLIKQVINDFLSKEINSITLYFDLFGCNHFSQINNFLKCYSSLNKIEYLFEELNFFLLRYNEIITKLASKNQELGQFFFDALSFRDYFETEFVGQNQFALLPNFIDKIDTIFERNIDKRVLLRLFDVLAEAIIHFLVYVHIQNEIETKIRAYFIFDNYELGSGIVDYWIVNHLYDYLEHKSLNDFISYEVVDSLKTKKVSDFIEFKILLATRYELTCKKIFNTVSEDKVKELVVSPLNEEEISSFLGKHTINKENREIYSMTFGIPFALELLAEKFDGNIEDKTKKEYFNIIAQKIFERINSKLYDTIKLLSLFDYFPEEAIRCLPENFPFYGKIFKYLCNETELTRKISDTMGFFEVKATYKFFIYNYLQFFEEDKFKDFSTFYSKFMQFFEPLRKFNPEERKVLRNIAYFKEFDLGATLQAIFQEDYKTVEQFVKSNQNLFIKSNLTYSLPDDTREMLLNFNKLVDNFRYNEKLDIISGIVRKTLDSLSKKVEKLKENKEIINKKIQKIQIIKSKIKVEIQELQKSIVANENYLIDLNSKKFTSHPKHIWFPFLFLTLFSILLFLAGNNIFYIFNETINIESIRGLGTALKIISLLIFGIMIFLLIDFFSSKEKKQAMQRSEDFIQQQEEKLSELKECLNEYKSTLKQFEIELSELLDEIEKIENEIITSVQILNIKYIENTTKN
ncbi:MAG: hypothetical protein N2560_02185 [Ignavibacteria bacterium]|nr:hypothetical protein [Ignavibacteria bacterium]